MIVKSDATYPLWFAAVVAVLLGYRVVVSLRKARERVAVGVVK
jgi:cytochrome c-type biogenesis protein CcmH/NrfF